EMGSGEPPKGRQGLGSSRLGCGELADPPPAGDGCQHIRSAVVPAGTAISRSTHSSLGGVGPPPTEARGGGRGIHRPKTHHEPVVAPVPARRTLGEFRGRTW